MFLFNVADGLWAGDSAAEKDADVSDVLNVAHDLKSTRGWRVGLVDGPGNRIEVYCAALYALHALRLEGRPVLVCCHSGSRALAVCAMYSALLNGCSWDNVMALLCERAECTLPEIHQAHFHALEKVRRCVKLS